MTAIRKPSDPDQYQTEKAREYLSANRVSDTLDHLEKYDNGERLRRILAAYEISDATEAGQVLFDILDKAAKVEDDEAVSQARAWIEYGERA